MIMRGKLIVIEGTDCSGKETQGKLLIQHLKDHGIKAEIFSFPNYDSPTGKIIGGPFLGKAAICDGWFPEGAVQVEPKVVSLYYAADRRYNLPKIEEKLDQGISLILDRYVYSNMAYQASKIEDTNERMNMYAWLDILEFKLLELPKPDITLFLHMPSECAKKLKGSRKEAPDQIERDEEYLKKAENSYIELSSVYKWKTVECTEQGRIKTIEEIGDEVLQIVLDQIKNA